MVRVFLICLLMQLRSQRFFPTNKSLCISLLKGLYKSVFLIINNSFGDMLLIILKYSLCDMFKSSE